MLKATKKKTCLKSVYGFFVVLAFLMSGCNSSKVQVNDIVTLKQSDKEKTQITVLVKYAFNLDAFEKAVEKKFPDIDIIQVGNYTANTALAKEYEERLKHDDLTDIVMTWPYDVGEKYWKDRLIDLSGLPFSSKYNTSMLDTIARDDGALYYLPGPAQIRGIIYNKTMFEEHAWEVPSNYDEFIALCKQIEAQGYRAFQLPLNNGEVLDTAFIGFNYGTAYSKPTDTQWLAEYNEGNGNFMDHFSQALDTFQDLIDQKIISSEDLELSYADTQKNLAQRKIVMSEDSVSITKWANSMSPTKDEYALMPFFSRIPENDWSRIFMTCYIGLNKHLQEDKEKYEKVLEVMDYISTPEGQKTLSQSDFGAMFSSLRNVDSPDAVEIHDLNKSLTQGRYGIFPTLERSENALRYGLKEMIKGSASKEQLARMVDRENSLDSTSSDVVTIGHASKDFTLIETGNFVCDVLRKAAKSDIALFLDNGKDGLYNGKGISAKFYKGDITDEDIARVFPDLKHEERGELCIVEMSGKNLKKALEYTLPVDNQKGWFYYFSGLKLTFDPYAEPGSRVTNITTSEGKKIENNVIYSVAVMDGSMNEDYVLSTKETGILIKDLLRKQIKSEKTITPSNDKRFTIKE